MRTDECLRSTDTFSIETPLSSSDTGGCAQAAAVGGSRGRQMRAADAGLTSELLRQAHLRTDVGLLN